MAGEPLELQAWECESLLRSHVVGRVGLVAADGPHVLPVNYSVVDGAIWMRTAVDSLLGRVSPGAVLAFQLDQFDHARHRGWSMLARGPAESVTEEAVLARLERVWPPRPWAAGERPAHVRLRWTELTGRKLGPGWDPQLGVEVRRTV